VTSQLGIPECNIIPELVPCQATLALFGSVDSDPAVAASPNNADARAFWDTPRTKIRRVIPPHADRRARPGRRIPAARGSKHRAIRTLKRASVTRPSRALRCGDLLCKFKLTRPPCQSILTVMDVEDLNLKLSSDDPAIGLRASLALRRLAQRVEANHVASAREKGWSWQQIGDALGVTRQSVHTKYNQESS